MPAPITPLPATYWDPAFGGHPATPSPTTTAAEAVSGNIGNLAGLYGLAGSVNAFNQAQAALGLERNLPGYGGMVAQSSRNIGAELAGQVEPDVLNELITTGAERGILTGGGPNANAAWLRALGLTSQGQQQRGEANLTGAIARTPQAPLFNPATFFVTPEQQQAAAMHAATVAATPVPAQAAAAQEAAANRGLARGFGSVPQAPRVTPPASWEGAFGGGGYLPPTTATGSIIGGVQYPAGYSPETAVANWNQWYSQTFPQLQPGATATATTPAGAGDQFGPSSPWDWTEADIFGDTAGGVPTAGNESLAPVTDMGYGPEWDMFSDMSFGG